MKNSITFSIAAICLTTTLCYAQRAPRADQRPAASREDALDPTPINSAVDPDVDLFIDDWRNSQPRSMYGKLVFRDILTRLEGSDPVHPAKKGAVLVNITAISYATLAPGAIVGGRAQKGERQETVMLKPKSYLSMANSNLLRKFRASFPQYYE